MPTIRKIALAIFCLPAPVFAANFASVPTDWSYVQKKLKREKFDPKFIKAMRKTYDPGEFTSILELNCLLFLRKSDYHGPQVSHQATEDVRAFLREHDRDLRAAERRYGVAPAVVAGLLWMESRFGTNLGRFHVPSVFLDLIQADRPQVIAHLKLEAAPRFAPRLTKKVAGDVTAKAKAKSKWAMSELKAVEKIYKRDRKLVSGLKGSFAGAFGLPQFIPSSYVHYARAARAGKTPDLARADDAIHSVAHYLKASGWKRHRESTHERALMKYNNSRDYARAILKIAADADHSFRTSRSPTSHKEQK